MYHLFFCKCAYLRINDKHLCFRFFIKNRSFFFQFHNKNWIKTLKRLIIHAFDLITNKNNDKYLRIKQCYLNYLGKGIGVNDVLLFEGTSKP